MSSAKYFRINTPQIVYEVIDAEMVIINFESGSYYSSDSLGCAIWSLIEQEHSLQDVAAIIESRYTSENLDLGQLVATFVEKLASEQLIVPTEAPGTAPIAEAPPGEPLRVNAPPALEKYRDMQELLLLDPIHDVDPAGWPMPKTEDD